MNGTRQRKDPMHWVNWSDARLLRHLIDGATADTPVNIVARPGGLELTVTIKGGERRVAALLDGETVWHAQEPGSTQRSMSDPGCEEALLKIVMRAGSTLGQEAINTITSLGQQS